MELLGQLGVAFTAEAAAIDECRLAGETPEAMTARLAREKAQAVYEEQTEESTNTPWVLGGDTTVALGDTIFGKPNDRQDAMVTLAALSGRAHRVISSVCLLNGTQIFKETVVSKVFFGKLSRSDIRAYCETDEPYDKAGAYGIQGAAAAFIHRIEGDYSAIVGLPLWATRQLLHRAGLVDTGVV